MADASVRAEWTGSIERFESMEAQWDALLAQSPSDSVFLTHAWLRHWWSSFGSAKKLLVVSFYRDAQPIGFAPLCFAGKKYSSAGFIEVMGEPVSDLQDLILAAQPGECLQALVKLLREMAPGYSCLELRLLRESSPTSRCLKEASFPGHWVAQAPLQIRERSAPYIDLSGGWKAYWQSRSAALRDDCGWQTRRLQRKGQVSFVAHDTPESLSELLEKMAAFSVARFKEQSIYNNPAWAAFYLKFGKEALKKGWLSAVSLKVGGETVAAHLGFIYKGAFYYHQPTINPAFQAYSPGKLLLQQLVQSAFESGLSRFDLGRGQDRYKMSWATAAEALLRFEILPKKAKSGAAFIGRRVKFAASAAYHQLCS